MRTTKITQKRSNYPSTAAPPCRRRSPVIYPDEITALYFCTIDWQKMCEDEDRQTVRKARNGKQQIYRKRKERSVIGICAVEKPWKINYRPCKGVENYIDRRHVPPKVWGADTQLSGSSPSGSRFPKPRYRQRTETDSSISSAIAIARIQTNVLFNLQLQNNDKLSLVIRMEKTCF